jgi:hypothetical protein
LELIRYIHLNPLRAGLVKDLKELDKYPWTGHSAIMGKKKNPFVPKQQANNFPFAGRRITFSQFRPETEKVTINPENPACPAVPREIHASDSETYYTGVAPADGTGVNPACPVGAKHRTGVKNKPLAEKTIEDVLLHFGDTLKVARRRYRQFVKNGIAQGTRPELQGGGLVRSAGGDKRALLRRKREERELGDARILGSGEFVNKTLEQSETLLEKKYLAKRPIEELIEIVAGKLGLKPELICSGNRRRQYSEARSLLAWLAVEEVGHSAAEVARFLGISRMGVQKAAIRRSELKGNQVSLE